MITKASYSSGVRSEFIGVGLESGGSGSEEGGGGGGCGGGGGGIGIGRIDGSWYGGNNGDRVTGVSPTGASGDEGDRRVLCGEFVGYAEGEVCSGEQWKARLEGVLCG